MERHNNSDKYASRDQQQQNDPKEAIKSKKDLQQPNDEKTDEDFPGYPHYPAKEDIMNPKLGLEKLPGDDENLTRSGAYIDKDAAVRGNVKPLREMDDDLGIVAGNEADVTIDDLIALGDERVSGKANEELDIPGAELDDEDEAIGEEDEENNYYSLGGDRHEDLEEDRS